MKGVHDALRRLEGVATVEVDLQSNLVVIQPTPDIELDLAAIPRAIRRAGFTPADMELVARGSFEQSGDRVSFRIAGWTRTLPVSSSDPSAGNPHGEVRLHATVDFRADPPVLTPVPR